MWAFSVKEDQTEKGFVLRGAFDDKSEDASLPFAPEGLFQKWKAHEEDLNSLKD